MTELPRKAVARTARLAALPLGYAGRNALGLGKRLGGKPAEAVMSEIQQRTAEQLFRTLGELKGGAMKFGQAMSVLEAALPDELAAPYRARADPAPGLRSPDADPDRARPDRRRPRARLADELVWLDGGPTAAASIGQVHRGRWRDGREVAVKVQYPGAGEALQSDLRQLARLARTIGPLVPGIDVKPLVEELQARADDELDYTLEAEAQRAFAEAFRGDPEIVVPDVVAVGETRAGHRVAGEPGLAGGGHRERHPGGARPLRRAVRAVPLRRPGAHRACCTPTRTPGTSGSCPNDDGSPGRLGVLDYGAVARLPDGGLPEAMGRLIRIAAAARRRRARRGAARRRASSRTGRGRRPGAGARLPRAVRRADQVERFRFSREWMQQQFQRINNPREPTYTLALKLNLPPAYLLIHRTWLGGVGVLSQLGAEAPFRADPDGVPPRLRRASVTRPSQRRSTRGQVGVAVVASVLLDQVDRGSSAG